MVRVRIISAISKIAGIETHRVHLETPEVEGHGDYASNAALVLAKKEKKNPKELAEEIAGKLKKDKDLLKIVSKIEVAGPGFINFWLSEEYLAENLAEIAQKGKKYGSSSLGSGKTVIIDYSAPNIAKRFSVGHLRSTVIGQAIYNLYEFLGYKVIGDNHLGDWGTQFGTLLHQITSKNLKAEELDIDKLEELYIEFNKEKEKDESLGEKARERFRKLEEGDSKAREIWKAVVEISMAEFDEIYKLLDVSIDVAYGESSYEEKMEEVLKLARKKGISKKSEGAEIIELKDMPPGMLLKSDGGTTYFTRDLATILFRIEKWDPSLIIYEVGAEQKLHFRQVFEASRMLGWEKGREFIHVAHGLFLADGKKMSTRKGTTVKLEKVLNESVKKAKEIIDRTETAKDLSNKEKEDISKAVGIGAVKYFDLLHSPTSNINFNWETLFNLQGDSGPYLQYTYARAKSVLKKAGKGKKDQKGFSLQNKERDVAASLVKFPQVVEDAAKNYSPNLLCSYLFSLAQKYSSFYNENKIIGSENESARLSLTNATAQVLENGLNLLGIKTPEKM